MNGSDLYWRAVWRSFVAALVLAGGILTFAAEQFDVASVAVAGYVMLGFGALMLGYGHYARLSWARMLGGLFLPAWAAIAIVLGGVGFLVGAAAIALR
jgi:hypothetical protein